MDVYKVEAVDGSLPRIAFRGSNGERMVMRTQVCFQARTAAGWMWRQVGHGGMLEGGGRLEGGSRLTVAAGWRVAAGWTRWQVGCGSRLDVAAGWRVASG